MIEQGRVYILLHTQDNRTPQFQGAAQVVHCIVVEASLR